MTSSAESPPMSADSLRGREANTLHHPAPFHDTEKYQDMEQELACQDVGGEQFQDSERDSPMEPEKGDGAELAHHARRPMNSFLIFCKHHRAVVRAKFPKLENRAITKILGEWWAILDKTEKAPFTKLAKEFKDAFFAAHPHFQWYKLPAPPLRSATARPNSVNLSDQELCPPNMDITEQTNNNDLVKINYNQPSTSKQTTPDKPTFTPGKLADEAQMGGLSSLILPAIETDIPNEYKINTTPPGTPNSKINTNFTPKPPKKRQIYERSDDIYDNDVSPPSDDQNKEKKLQDALSETMRSFRETDAEFNDSYSKLPEEEMSDNVSPVSDVTNQKLIDEVVNKEFPYSDSWNESQESQDSQIEGSNNAYMGDDNQVPGRASGRAKKGKLYQAFMADGGLMGNKRHKKDYDTKMSPKTEMPSKYNWNLTKKGATKSELITYNSSKVTETSPDATLMNIPDVSSEVDEMGQQTFFYDENASEHSEEIIDAGNKPFDFDLEDRIAGLPTLSFEEYSTKKKENKKRKKFSKQSNAKKLCAPLNNQYSEYTFNNVGGDFFNRSDDLRETNAQSKSATDYRPQTNHASMSHNDRMYLVEERKSAIIGSKKRKPRKNSINRIEISSSTNLQHNLKLEAAKHIEKVPPISVPVMVSQSPVLCGLDTLAEVAANTCKMEEET